MEDSPALDATSKMHNRKEGAIPVAMTEGNAVSITTLNKKRKRRKGSEIYGFGKLVLLILVCGFFVVVSVQQRSSLSFPKESSEEESNFYQDTAASNKEKEFNNNVPDTVVLLDDEKQRQQQRQQLEKNKQQLASPLDDFSSLQSALQTFDLVALYFAASWCPMSTPVTNLLDELFRDMLGTKQQQQQQQRLFSIVYVSSDKTEEAFNDYLKPGWLTVPYSNMEERAAIKRHFKTCARREMKELALVTRDYEIPSLIVIAGAGTQQHEVLTYTGVQDIKELGASAVDHWMKKMEAALETKLYE